MSSYSTLPSQLTPEPTRVVSSFKATFRNPYEALQPPVLPPISSKAMSRVYNQASAPLMISSSRASSDAPRQLDLMQMDSDSIFLITLARSNFSDPSTPTTPIRQSTSGSATFTFSSPTAFPRPTVYSLFADREETFYREAHVWPTGFFYEDEDEYRPSVSATPSRPSSGSYPRGQAVQVHHGTARITAWAKKAFMKVTPKGWRRLDDEASQRGRMTLD